MFDAEKFVEDQIATGVTPKVAEEIATLIKADKARQDRMASRVAAREKERRELEEFKGRMMEKFSYSDRTATFNVVFNRAWEEGHAYGFQEVENCLEDLLEFVDEIQQAAIVDGVARI